MKTKGVHRTNQDETYERSGTINQDNNSKMHQQGIKDTRHQQEVKRDDENDDDPKWVPTNTPSTDEN